MVKAGTDQMSVLNTNNRFLHDNIVMLAEKLADTFPGDLSVCFIVNSGYAVVTVRVLVYPLIAH